MDDDLTPASENAEDTEERCPKCNSITIEAEEPRNINGYYYAKFKCLNTDCIHNTCYFDKQVTDGGLL